MLISCSARVDVRPANNRLREAELRPPASPTGAPFPDFRPHTSPLCFPGPSRACRCRGHPTKLFRPPRLSQRPKGRGEEAREEAAGGRGRVARGPRKRRRLPAALREGLRAPIRPGPGPLSAPPRTPSESFPGRRDAQPRPHLDAAARPLEGHWPL